MIPPDSDNLDDSDEDLVAEFMALAHDAFADDWNAPGMDAYDELDRNGDDGEPTR
jgi:hypothetical protein